MMATDTDVLALGLSRTEEDKFHLWEKGLPTAEELVPLNQSLISPVLARAFSIKEFAPVKKPPLETESEHPAQAAVRSFLQSAPGSKGRNALDLQLLPGLAEGPDALPAGGGSGQPLPQAPERARANVSGDDANKRSSDAGGRGGEKDDGQGLFGKQQKGAEESNVEERPRKQQRRQWLDEEEQDERFVAGASRNHGNDNSRFLPKKNNASPQENASHRQGDRQRCSDGEDEGMERRQVGERQRHGEKRAQESFKKREKNSAPEAEEEDVDEVDERGRRTSIDDENAGSRRPTRQSAGDSGDSVEHLEKPQEGAGEEAYGEDDGSGGKGSSQEKRKNKKARLIEEEFRDDSGDNNSSDELNPRTLKRPRLVWTPQLHKRFVDAVSHLGIKNAVPKTIMQLMNVEGLTRENVASHLQKYRLYLKRMQGLSSDGPSASDHLFASAPMPAPLSSPQHQRMQMGSTGVAAGQQGAGALRDSANTGQAAGFHPSGLPGGPDPSAASAGAAAAVAAAALGGQSSLLLNDQLAQSLAGGDPLGRTLNAYAAAAAAAAGAYDIRQQLPFLPGGIHPLLAAGGNLGAWGGLPGVALGGAAGLAAASGMNPGDASAAAAAAGFGAGHGALANLVSAGRLPNASLNNPALNGGLSNLPGGGGFGAAGFHGAGIPTTNAAAALSGFGGSFGGMGGLGVYGDAERREMARERQLAAAAAASPDSPRPPSPPKRALNLFPEA